MWNSFWEENICNHIVTNITQLFDIFIENPELKKNMTINTAVTSNASDEGMMIAWLNTVANLKMKMLRQLNNILLKNLLGYLSFVFTRNNNFHTKPSNRQSRRIHCNCIRWKEETFINITWYLLWRNGPPILTSNR